MKKINQLLLLASFSLVLTFQSCSKDDPTPENDQEEVGGAQLIFTEVEREAHGDHFHYNPIEMPETDTVTFSGTPPLAPVGTHLHLEVGKTYKLELVAKDYAGRETQKTFIDRDDIHQVFILGAPTGTLDYVYADKKEDGTKVNVGVTGYLTVNSLSNTFVLNYILRHLNPGIKQNITALDWNNINYTSFSGATDLDLKVEVHLVDGDHDHDGHE